MKKWTEIEQYVLQLIRSGTISEGERLPSIRSMATYQGISVTPVSQAYQHLEKIGVVACRPNSGYFVRKFPAERDLQDGSARKIQVEKIGRRYASYLKLVCGLSGENPSPFGASAISTHFVQQRRLEAGIVRALKAYPSDINPQDSEITEVPELCREIAKWMVPTGCNVLESNIIVTAGAMQGIQLALLSCTSHGDIVAVEDPGCMLFYSAIEVLGLQMMRISSDIETGLQVNELADILQDPDGPKPACLLLCSNFSNPTGAIMSTESKYALAMLCEKYSIPIIEDDAIGDLGFLKGRPKPIKYYAPDNVIYISCFTKTLSPVYRVGWIEPGKYADDVRFYKGILPNTVSSTVRHAFAAYLKSPASRRQLTDLRAQLCTLSSIYQKKLIEYFPNNTAVSHPAGSPYLWVTLPQGMDVIALAAAAKECGISIAPGYMFSMRRECHSSFRLNVAARKWDECAERDLKRLGALAFRLMESPGAFAGCSPWEEGNRPSCPLQNR